jgi:hypothetical protein
MRQDVRNDLQQLARDSQADFAREIENAGPKVRKALLKNFDISNDIAKMQQKVQQAISGRANETARLNALDERRNRLDAEAISNARTLSYFETALGKAKSDRASQERVLGDLQRKYSEDSAKHAKQLKEIRDLELSLTEARLKGQRTVQNPTTGRFMNLTQGKLLKNQWQQEESDFRASLARQSADIDRAKGKFAELDESVKTTQSSIDRGRKNTEQITKDLTQANKAFSDSQRDVARYTDEETRNRERLNRSLLEQIDARDKLRRATGEEDDRKKRNGFGGKVSAALGNSLTDIPFVPSGPAGLMVFAAVLPVLAQVANMVTVATQALWLMPAALSAVGIGFGTAALATHGFGQALQDMGDPKKFAQDLQGMAPAAQQAALEIQSLVQGPLGELKRAVEESFFSGIGKEIRDLTNQYLPSVQTLLTSISGSFNGALKGIGDQLMQPDTQAALQNTFNNIATFFREISAAAPNVVKAFADIASVGSDLLPGIGQSIAEAAQGFAMFIRDAAQTGELKRWMQEGIDAVKGLGQVIWGLLQIIYDVFGGDAKQSVENFKNGLNNIRVVVAALNGDFSGLGAIIRKNFEDVKLPELMGEWGTAVINWCNSFVQNVVNGPIKFLNYLLNMWNAIPLLPDIHIPEVPSFSHTYNNTYDGGPSGGTTTGGGHYVPGGGRTPGFTPPTPAFGQPDLGGNANSQRERRGLAPLPAPANGFPTAGLDPWTNLPVPAAPPAGGGSKPSQKDIDDQIRAGIPIQSIDPFAPIGGGPALPGPGLPAAGPGATISGPFGIQIPMPGGASPSGLGGAVDQKALSDKAHELQKDAWDLAREMQDLEVFKKDNLHTQAEIIDQEHKVQELRWKHDSDLMEYQKIQQGKTASGSSGNNSLGAGLDNDLGLSRGLPGLADNLVRFVGTLLMSPILAALNQITGGKSASETGFGLLGVMGANAGLGGTSGMPNYGGASVSGYATAGGPIGSKLPGESDRDFAHRVMAPYWQSQGLQVGDHAADQYKEHQNGALDIMVPNLQVGQQVLQQVLSDPNVYGAIFNRQSYGYGHGIAGQPYTGPNPHTDHVHAFYKPGDPNDITPMAGGGPLNLGGSSGGFGGGNIPIPLPVTIVGGGGGGPGGLPGLPGGIGQSGGIPGANNAGYGILGNGGGGLNWDALAAAESGTPGVPGSANWANKTNPKYSGGLQFNQGTWNDYKLPGFPDIPADATKEQQIAAAQNALSQGRTPQSLWPQNYGLLGAPGGGAGPLPGIMPGAGGTGFLGGGTPAGGNPYNQEQAPVGRNTGEGGWQPQGGGGFGISGGGAIGAGMAAAAGAGAGGAGAGVGAAMALAQTAQQLINRTIAYGGQAASIGVQGLFETFGLSQSPLGDMSKSWFGRVLSGLAGARPAVPNMAGKQSDDKKDQSKQQPNADQAQGKQGGPMVNIESFVQAPNRNGQQTAQDLALQMHAAGTPR